jgi:hypothetical protein
MSKLYIIYVLVAIHDGHLSIWFLRVPKLIQVVQWNRSQSLVLVVDHVTPAYWSAATTE